MARFPSSPSRAGRRRIVLILSAMLCGMPAMAMSQTARQGATAPIALEAAKPTEVVIHNFSFAPATVTIAAGTAVVWTNHDDTPHTIVDGDDAHLFKSGPLDTNDAFRFVFRHPGTYHYFCSLHPMMQGTIVVR